MKDPALARRLLLVISIFPLFVTVPFVIWPQLAAEFGSLPSAESMAELKDAQRQSASNRGITQTVWIQGGEFSMGSDRSFQMPVLGIACASTASTWTRRL